MMGLFGYVGQHGYNLFSMSSDPNNELAKPLGARFLGSSWVPLKALSDEQYEDMLNEKLLRTEAEISLIDEKIAALKALQLQGARRETVDTSKGAI